MDQQTATAGILTAIAASPADAGPVFAAIVESVQRLFHGAWVNVVLRKGDQIDWAATSAASFPAEAFTLAKKIFPQPLDRDSLAGRAILDRTAITISDVTAPGVPARARAISQQSGARSLMAVPMVREGTAIGALMLWRSKPGDFSDEQKSMLRTFADQAVIAIENVRLFNELQARNEDLSESLERETATTDILRVIAGSPSDTRPVFETIARSTSRLCDGAFAVVGRYDGTLLHLAAQHNPRPGTSTPAGRAYPRALGRDLALSRAVMDRAIVHIPDTRKDSELSQEFVQAIGAGSLLAVPMMREGKPIGAIGVSRLEVGSFPRTQVELLKVFADQAVIAIENARLLKELEARNKELAESLEQQTASSEILSTISSNQTDLHPVFETIVRNAVRMGGGKYGLLFRCEGGQADVVASNFPSEAWDYFRRQYPQPLSAENPSLESIVTRKVINMPDIFDSPYSASAKKRAEVLGYRSLVAVPLMRDNEAIGTIAVAKETVGKFPENYVALLQTFADQAVIAIENVRLFNEIQDKTRQLEVANKHKSDFLAHMSHELRTPLNAVIGFSEVLMDKLFGEVNEKQLDYLKDIHESGKHLLSLINDILDLSKIEAGRMELEVSRFHLPTALSNAMTLIRERAQRHGIQLGLEIDERICDFDGDERKVKQIMLNLLSNAVKFTPDGGRIDVRASLDTGNVFILVTDTGIGMEPADQHRLFEEFRQVGNDSRRKAEGTGLGLALTRKLARLHGGDITVASHIGKGSTFTVVLPIRATAAAAAQEAPKAA